MFDTKSMGNPDFYTKSMGITGKPPFLMGNPCISPAISLVDVPLPHSECVREARTSVMAEENCFPSGLVMVPKIWTLEAAVVLLVDQCGVHNWWQIM